MGNDETGGSSSAGQETDPKILFEKAREADKSGQHRDALRIYGQIIEAFHDKDGAEEIVSLSRSLRRTLLERVDSNLMGPLQTLIGISLGFGIWILVSLGVAAIFSENVRTWWTTSWKWVVVTTLALIVLMWLSQLLEKKLALTTKAKRRAVLAFLVIPIITLAMMAVIVLGANRMALVLELILILVAALLPAVTYYLFLVVRRPSIFNEFLSNLSGLGLLSPHPVKQRAETAEGNVYVEIGYESHEERRVRVESYIQSFESVYGTLRFDTDNDNQLGRSEFVKNLLDSIDRKNPELQMPQTFVQLSDIFRATLVIPIGLVTILTTLGWLLTMQPDIGAEPGDAKMFFWSGEVGTSPAADAGTLEATSSDETRGATEGSDGEGNNPAVSGKPSAWTEPASVTRYIAELLPTITPAGFAFLGAYFFGIQMLFRRFVRRDLSPNAYMALANRILLAWIATWVALVIYSVITGNLTDSGGDAVGVITSPFQESRQWSPEIIGIAFILGAFPRILWQFLNTFVAKVLFLKLVLPTIETKQPLVDLDGLTIWHEARLEEEDVENVPNMATVDILDILLHTQIPAERLISWIDQSILYSILGPEPADGGKGDQVSPRENLRKLCIRNATQIVEAWHGSNDEKAALKRALGDETAATIINAIKIESNFNIVNTWRIGTKYG